MHEISYNFHKNHDLILDKECYLKKGLSGIINTGNKCYSNSIIQCLSHTLKLTDYFLSKKYRSDYVESNFRRKKEYLFSVVYKNLLFNLWEFNDLQNPRMFYEKILTFLPKYNNNQQHDSHEFLIDFLNVLHNSISYKIDVNISGEIQNETDKLMKSSLIQWKNMYQNDYSEIVKIFNGMTINLIKCNSCKYESDSIFEFFNCINLNLNNSDTLNQCLEYYFNKSMIDDWKCDKCNNLGCSRELNLWTLPNYLIIHLKRFDENGKKIKSYIDFPIDDLDLTPYICHKKNDPNNYIYSLYAVNYHEGDIKNGHYWTSVKNLNSKWYTFNNGNVNENNNTVDIKTQLVTPNAYILFYYKKFIK